MKISNETEYKAALSIFEFVTQLPHDETNFILDELIQAMEIYENNLPEVQQLEKECQLLYEQKKHGPWKTLYLAEHC